MPAKSTPAASSSELRNDRALRIARAPRGEPDVFGAALSADGVAALCLAAERVSGSVGHPWPAPSYDRLLRVAPPAYAPALRLYTLAVTLVRMRHARVEPAEPGWTLGPVDVGNAVVRGIPVRVPPPDSGRRADTVVVRALAAAAAQDGATALAEVVERADMPDPVMLNIHPRPLLPSALAVGVPPQLRGGTVSPVVPDVYATVGWLPNLGLSGIGKPVLPLPLYSLMTLRSDRKRGGHSADLALRIFIEGVTAVMRRDWRRAVRQVVGITVPFREFLSWFYHRRHPRPTEYWRHLVAACEALDSADARFPYSADGGGRRRVVSLGDIPRTPFALSDNVTLRVNLPPGASDGPAINRERLRYWGRVSEVAYRALLGLAYHWYQPGLTRLPRSGGGWIQSRDPERYEPFTDDGLIALCYPVSKMQRRSNLRRRAWSTLRALERAGDVVILGNRLLPPPNSP